MDIVLARTFLAVLEQGSFVRASAQLHVTQSTVSARIKSLEQLLGQAVFRRNKAECVATSAGRRFEAYARSLVRVWEEARQQVAIPDGFLRALAIGGQYSLWSGLLMRWLADFRRAQQDVAIRASLASPQGLLSGLRDGVLDVAVLYGSQTAPGIRVEKLVEDELILLTSDPQEVYTDRYVYLDWGEAFRVFHAQHHSALPTHGMSLDLGALGLDYLISNRRAGYAPNIVAAPMIANNLLHAVREAPRMSYPVFLAWRDDYGDPGLMQETIASIRAGALDMLRSTVGERRRRKRVGAGPS